MYRRMSRTWRDLRAKSKMIIKEKAAEWRRAPTIMSLDKPTRLDAARRLGYKAKQGYVIARIRIDRGGYRRSRPSSGRRPKHLGAVRIKKGPGGKKTAEQRVAKQYPNLKILNSYLLHRDAWYAYYEVIMVDPHHPSIKADRDLKRQLPSTARSVLE